MNNFCFSLCVEGLGLWRWISAQVMGNELCDANTRLKVPFADLAHAAKVEMLRNLLSLLQAKVFFDSLSSNLSDAIVMSSGLSQLGYENLLLRFKDKVIYCGKPFKEDIITSWKRKIR